MPVCEQDICAAEMPKADLATEFGSITFDVSNDASSPHNGIDDENLF